MKSFKELTDGEFDAIPDLIKDTDHANIAWTNKLYFEEMDKNFDEMDRKLEKKFMTYETLMENERYRNLSKKTQDVVWELAKIRMNDSPKNQSEVAEQYGVTDAHISQCREYLEDIGF